MSKIKQIFPLVLIKLLKKNKFTYFFASDARWGLNSQFYNLLKKKKSKRKENRKRKEKRVSLCNF